MTQEELEIAQATCCVGTMWDQYEGTEKFNEMVGKRVRHLIELVRNHLEQEQPEVDEIELDGMAIDFRNTIKPKPHTNLYYEDQIYNAYKAGFRKGLNARKEQI